METLFLGHEIKYWVELKRDRLELTYSSADRSVGGRIDITPVYYFLKEFFRENKKLLGKKSSTKL